MNDLETRLHDLGPTLDEAMGEAPPAWPSYPSSADASPGAVRARRPWMVAAAAVVALGAVGVGVERLDPSDERTVAATSVPSAVPGTIPLSREGFPLVLPSDPEWRGGGSLLWYTVPGAETGDSVEGMGFGFGSDHGSDHLEITVTPLDSTIAASLRAAIEEEGAQVEERQVLGFPAQVYTEAWQDPQDVPLGETMPDQHAILSVGNQLLDIHSFLPPDDFRALLDTLQFVDEATWREHVPVAEEDLEVPSEPAGLPE
jgi:hypothetical protein